MSGPQAVELLYASPGFFRDAFRVARKDLLIEFRTRSAFLAAGARVAVGYRAWRAVGDFRVFRHSRFASVIRR